MPAVVAERVGETVVRWLADDQPFDGWDNAAGPLFPSSEYAESEITPSADGGTTHDNDVPAGMCDREEEFG